MASPELCKSMMQVARDVHTVREKAPNKATIGSLRNVVNAGQNLESVLKAIKYVEDANQSPKPWPVGAAMDHDFMDPWNYEKSLVILARDIDAHPWGAFGINHPSMYLPFLQQLASDLMSS